MLSKYRGNGDKEFAPVYFNSATKTVINSEYTLDKSFQEILYRIDNWINGRSVWIIESIEDQYVNVSIYMKMISTHSTAQSFGQFGLMVEFSLTN